MMNTRDYLDRIKISRVEEASHAFLARLQRQHLLTVPFENLDITKGQKIVLDESRLYNKIVVRRRGGFCYELNGLFSWLLRNLGFSVSIVSARVYDTAKDQFGPEFDHLVLLIHLEKTYLADVGFGDSFRTPIELPNGGVKDVSGRYRVFPLASGQDAYVVQEQGKDRWLSEYTFTTYPRELLDFAQMCVYHQTSSESHFTQLTVCTIATDQGRVTLSDNSLTITEGKAKRKMPVPSPEGYKRMLFEHFGVELENA